MFIHLPINLNPDVPIDQDKAQNSTLLSSQIDPPFNTTKNAVTIWCSRQSFTCSLCNTLPNPNSFLGINNHLNNSHKNIKSITLGCSFCRKSNFNKFSDLTLHLTYCNVASAASSSKTTITTLPVT
ncbi:hypothetical protein RF11_02889 [Thelohanellus kitauei]|uniref:Uncharacterized protein n=1 Tax=Thelohanellus kitauei TaxID=669202 RepID=A0A0C2MY65_THEKT|nr:hypothetical protein RF11_02889 [Thelohanellus kitauei]